MSTPDPRTEAAADLYFSLHVKMFVMNKEGLQRYIDYWKGGEWCPIAEPREATT